jgi:hypothetical protein
MNNLTIVLILHAVVSCFLGDSISRQKNRNRNEGRLLGFFLGLIGVIIVSILPNKNPKPQNISTSDKAKSIGKRILYGIGRFIVFAFFHSGFIIYLDNIEELNPVREYDFENAFTYSIIKITSYYVGILYTLRGKKMFFY